MLDLRAISVSAGGKVLVSGIGITLEKGEMVALCGPSGCGKTTLLRAVAGLDDLTGGLVLLNGSTPNEIGWPHFRRRVVLVDQRPVLLPGSVRDNLALPFTYAVSAGTAFPVEEAHALLETFGVTRDRFAQEARTLSQGQQQRVCLARAFLLKPEVLLLDEPTSALDPEAVSSVENSLRTETLRRGLSALIVTHDREQARRLCDRAVDLSDFGAVANVG
ncbi:MAG: ATP-binding cassette domain-containing protein [Candidatus Fermentibacteraceae bacterium]